MPAYLIGRLQMKDPSWLGPYRENVPATLEAHGGRYLARGGAMERLEGSDELPSTLVVIEFPTADAARAWHGSPEYAPYKAMRQEGSDMEVVLTEGL